MQSTHNFSISKRRYLDVKRNSVCVDGQFHCLLRKNGTEIVGHVLMCVASPPKPNSHLRGVFLAARKISFQFLTSVKTLDVFFMNSIQIDS